VGDAKEWVKLVEFGALAADRNPKTIADAVVSLLSRIKNRSSLDNSKCLDAIDLTSIARRIRRMYGELLEQQRGITSRASEGNEV